MKEDEGFTEFAHGSSVIGAPDYVLSTDGGYFENKEFASKTASARKRLLSHGTHEVEISWDEELDSGYNGKDSRAKVLIQCTCGIRTSYGPSRVNKDGAIPTTFITGFNSHILAIQSTEESERQMKEVGEEPSLVAKVHLVRVTHEWWVYHVNSDLGAEILGPNRLTQYRGYDWRSAVKQSRGWKRKGSHQTKEQAIANVLALIEKQRYKGYRVEVFDISTKIGVEAPIATIHTAVRKLLDQAKALKVTATPHEIGAVLQVTEDGLTQLGMLIDLKEDLSSRFAQALDLE